MKIIKNYKTISRICKKNNPINDGRWYWTYLLIFVIDTTIPVKLISLSTIWLSFDFYRVKIWWESIIQQINFFDVTKSNVRSFISQIKQFFPDLLLFGYATKISKQHLSQELNTWMVTISYEKRSFRYKKKRFNTF